MLHTGVFSEKPKTTLEDFFGQPLKATRARYI
jgi:hypothetical protein